MQKEIVILGVGGHGWESLIDFLDNTAATNVEPISNQPQKYEVSMYGQTSDWGGFTGLLGRLMESQDHQLNLQLHQKKLPVLPWGDLNKRLSYYFTRKFGANVGQVLDFRSYHIWELKQEFEILSDFLALDYFTVKQFSAYLENFVTYFQQHTHQLEYSTPVCLGNLWNQYLFWQLDSMEVWNEYYQSKNILPENISFWFTSQNREVLTGKDLQGQDLVGEDKIDVSELPILANSLQLLRPESSLTDTPETQFLTKLNQAAMIIIPNGSVANWLPLVNQPEILDILSKKSVENKLMWLLNLFHTPNELKIHSYVEYLHSLQIFPLIIGPKDLFEKPSTEVLNKYRLENKFLNLVTAEDTKKMMQLSENMLFELEYNLNHTFKYQPQSVHKSLSKILYAQ